MEMQRPPFNLCRPSVLFFKALPTTTLTPTHTHTHMPWLPLGNHPYIKCKAVPWMAEGVTSWW